MVCDQTDQPKEGSHAFTDEFYGFSHEDSSVGIAMALAGELVERHRTANLHGRRRLEHRAARRRAVDFRLCSLPRCGGRAERPGHLRCLEGRAAQNTSRPRTSVERSIDPPFVAWHAPTRLGSGDRLAFDSLLRRASGEQKRTLLWQAAPGNHEVSCLRHGVHCLSRSALYLGALLGASPRNDRDRPQETARSHRRFGPENQSFVAGSSFLQRARDFVFARATAAVSDAGDVSWPAEEEGQATHRAPLDSAAGSGTISAHPQESSASSPHYGRGHLPNFSQTRQTWPRETSVRRLAGTGDAVSDPTFVPNALWHRGQLPPASPGTHLHLHTRSTFAVGICRHCVAAAQPLGLDSRRAARPQEWSASRRLLGEAPLQATAAMAGQCNPDSIPR